MKLRFMGSVWKVVVMMRDFFPRVTRWGVVPPPPAAERRGRSGEGPTAAGPVGSLSPLSIRYRFMSFLSLSLGVHLFVLILPLNNPWQKTRNENLQIVERVGLRRKMHFDFHTSALSAPLKEKGISELENVEEMIKGNVKPTYPLLARRLKISGTAVVTVQVATDGKIKDIVFKKTSGHSLLDLAIVSAVKTWKIPHRQKKDFWLTLPPFEFRLKKDP